MPPSPPFTTETFDAPESGRPTPYGRFSRHWQDEATEVYERAYKQALAHIPKGFKGQITWGEVDNRPFLRLAHGTLLGLMHRHDKAKSGRNRHGAGQADAGLAPHGQHRRALLAG